MKMRIKGRKRKKKRVNWRIAGQLGREKDAKKAGWGREKKTVWMIGLVKLYPVQLGRLYSIRISGMILLVLRGEYLSRQEGEKERQCVHGRYVFLRVYELRGRKEREKTHQISRTQAGALIRTNALWPACSARPRA